MADLNVALRVQAEACAELGSPMYAALLHRSADQLSRTGPLQRVLAGHEADSGPSALALRLLGTVHRLVLERRAGALALHYPSVGGTWDLDAAWPALLALLDAEHDEIRAGLERPPQTNEVGRSAGLVGALLRLSATAPLRHPVRLVELGASAGLNLRADRFRYVGAGQSWGPEHSPVVLPGAWAGGPTPVDQSLEVVERLGCDASPIDPSTTAGRILLTAYVWPDQTARIERLRGAFEVAAEVPVELRRQRAQDLVAGLTLRAGTRTVLWHSVLWQYLDDAERTMVGLHIARLADSATADMPFAHVFLEPARRDPSAAHEFLVCVEQWPGERAGDRVVLGTSAGHGLPVTWDR